MTLSNEKKFTLIIILSAAGLQLLWLAAIGWTGASSDWLRLILIGLISLGSTMLVLWIPDRSLRKIQAVLNQPGTTQKVLIGLLITGALVIGAIYITNQRVWSDEEENLVPASILASQGFQAFIKEYATNDFYTNRHPPLMPFLYGLAIEVLGPQLSSMRILAFLFCIGVIRMAFLLARNFYDSPTGMIGAILLATFPLIIRLGSAGMLDIPVTFFFLLSLWLCFQLKKYPTYWLAASIGVVLFITTMIRYTGGLVVLVILLIPILFKSYKQYLPQIILALIVFCVLFGMWIFTSHQLGLAVPVVSRFVPFGWKDTNQILPVTFSAEWAFNPTDGLDWVMNSLLTRLPSAIGVYHFPVILIAGLTALKARKSVDLFLIGWIAIIFISILLTLPDHRYFMPAFPALAILMAGWLKEKPDLNLRYTILSVCFLLSSLVLFIDWDRQAELFIK